MALVASSSSHSLPFPPSAHEWPRLNEQYTYNGARPGRMSILVRHVSYENPFSNSGETQSLRASNSIKDNLTKAASTSELFGYTSRKQSASISDSNAECKFDPPKTHVNTGKQFSNSDCCIANLNDLSNEPFEQELPERVALSEPCDAKDMPHSDNTEDDKFISEHGNKDCTNTEVSQTVCIRKKKRLKRVRQKSFRKWKPLHCAELGFHNSAMPQIPHEDLYLNNGNIAEDACFAEEVTQSEALEHVVNNDNKIIADNDIAQSEPDDVTFFHALGVDVLNFDYNNIEDDFLDWDGVYFPVKMHAVQPLLNTEPSYKPKGKSRLKSKLTANGQTDTPISVPIKTNRLTEAENINTLSSPSIVFSRMKKCDRYKLFELECSSSKRIYYRRDRDRKREKIHKAVKSKNCRSIFNNIGRKRMYMHHRLIKMHNLDLDFRGSVKSYRIPSMPKTNIALDVAKNTFRADRKTGANDQPAPVQNLNHALHETNSAGHLESELASFLITLQHRDLTPEDYDMLLRLDDSVKPKTVSDSLLEKLRTETIGPNGPEQGSSDWEPMCTICMELYIVGQERKFLPCGHDFHTLCIDRWLKNSSLNCPLDGLPIESS